MREFDTNWDPYTALLQAENNIMQLASAYNEHQAQLEQLKALVTHQQEVIQQLVRQNNKVTQQTHFQNNEITRLKTEIELLKAK